MTFRDGQLQTAGGRRVRPGVILALVCAAQFMVTLGLVVVNVALPAMQKDPRLGPSDLQWVVITYGLAFGGFLLLLLLRAGHDEAPARPREPAPGPVPGAA